MRHFNLVKSLTRVINNYKGLLILCLSLAVFGVESAWGISKTKLSVTAQGGGQIAITKNTTAPSSYSSTASATNEHGLFDVDKKDTYYIWLKPNTGFSCSGYKVESNENRVESCALDGTNKYKIVIKGFTSEQDTKVTITFTTTFYAAAYAKADQAVGGGVYISLNGNWPSSDANYIADDSSTRNLENQTSEPTIDANYDAKAKTGYTFKGWFTSTSGSGTKTSSEAKYVEKLKVTSQNSSARTSITRYAYFTPNTYTIAFNGNGNTGGSTASVSAIYDQDATLPENGFTKTGYTFVGWKLNNTGDTKQAGDKVKNLTATQGETATYYAQWTENKYSLYLDFDGGKFGEETYYSVPSTSPTTLLYGKSNFSDVSWKVPTREGYTFKGFYDADGNQAYDAEGHSVDGKYWSNKNYKIDGDLTAKAKWQINTHSLTWDFAGGSTSSTTYTPTGTYNYNTSITYPADNTMSRAGYTFNGWDKIITIMPDENVTITAQWTANKYTINYYDQGDVAYSGNNKSSLPAKHTYDTQTNLVNGTKTGYTFDGWFTNSGCTGIAVTTLGATDYTADITLYAKWTAETYTITYKDQGNKDFSGTHELGYPTKHTYDESTNLKGATKTGYTFAGWYKESNCSGSAVTTIGGTEYTADFTLYAQWTANTYTVTFKGNGGSPESQTVSETYDAYYVLPATEPTRANYEFAGWYLNSEYIDETKQVKVTDNNQVALAQWKPKFYFGFEYEQKGEGLVEITGYTSPVIGNVGDPKGSTTATYTATAADGWQFVDWCTDADYQNVASKESPYAVTLENDKVGEANKKTTKLYAEFQKLIKYYATAYAQAIPNEAGVGQIFVSCQGKTPEQGTWTESGSLASNTNDPGDGAVGGGITVTMDFYAQPKAGYTFKGWFTDAAHSTSAGSYEGENNKHTETQATDIQTTPGATKTLYAWFEPKSYTVTLVAGNGGTDGSAGVTYKSASISVTDATRDGYTLKGYYTAATGGQLVISKGGELQVGVEGYTDSEGKWNNTSDEAKLYAQWEAGLNTVTLEGGDGSDGLAQIYSGGDELDIKTWPSYVGYEVEGYYTQAAGGTKIADGEGKLVSGDVDGFVASGKWCGGNGKTIYAYWTEATYTITLNGGDGATTGEAKVKLNTNALISIKHATRAGYDVSGYFAQGGVMVIDASGNLVNAEGYVEGGKWVKTSDLTLTAQWTPHTYTITLDKNSGTNNGSAQITTEDIQLTSITAPTHSGYGVVGYLSASNGTLVADAKGYLQKDVNGFTDANGKWIGEDKTLYAKWEVMYTITIAYDDNKTGSSGTGSGSTVAYVLASGTQIIIDTWPTNGDKAFYGFCDDNTRPIWGGFAPGGTIVIGSDGTLQKNISGYTDANGHWIGGNNKTLHVMWKSSDYTVCTITFDHQGGTVDGQSSTTAKAAREGTMPPIDMPIRKGYTLEGYYTETEGKGTKYYDASLSCSRTTPDQSTFILYANWTANSYILTFDNQEATTTGTTTLSVKYDSQVSSITPPTRDGYDFKGYFEYEEGGGNKYFNTDGSYARSSKNWDEDSNRKVYAYWQPASYDVTLNPNGGSGSEVVVSATMGESMPNKDKQGAGLSPISRTGYIFDGYFDGTGETAKKYYNANMTSAAAWDKTSAYTLYAHWTPITYTVNFAKGDDAAKGSMGAQTITYDVATNLNKNEFTKEYTVSFDVNGGSSSKPADAKASIDFDHWTDGTKSYTDEASVTNLRNTLGAEVTLTAVWKTTANATKLAATPTRTGYTFNGWWTDATAGSKAGDAGGSYTPISNITLYAHWMAKTYEVTFNANGGTPDGQKATVTFDANYIYPTPYEEPTMTGKSFIGWFDAEEGGNQIHFDGEENPTKVAITSNQTIYAQWADPYTVTLAVNEAEAVAGKANVTSSSTSLYNITAPTRTGYEVESYYLSDMTTKVANKDGSLVAGIRQYTTNISKWIGGDGKTLYTKWTPCTYTITINANGGLSNWSATATYNNNKLEIGTPSSRTGYSLQRYITTNGDEIAAWSGVLANNVNGYTDAFGNWIRTSETTILADWKANTYTITLAKGNGGTTDGTATIDYNGNTFKTYQDATKTNYVLEGYYNTNGVKVITANGQLIASVKDYTDDAGNWIKADNATLTAYWENNITLGKGTYGSANGSATIVTNGTKLNNLTAPTPTESNYSITGYYTDASNGTLIINADGSLVSGTVSGYVTEGKWTGGDKTLYAQWKNTVTYKVTLNANGGTGGTELVNAPKGEAMPAATAPTKTGYTFLGYYDNQAEGQGTQYYTAQMGSARNWDKNDNGELWAHWQANTYTVNFNANGGSVSPTLSTVTYDKTYGEGTAWPTPTLTGYDFDGWYTAADGGTEVKSTDKVQITTTQTLYAHWKAHTYKVTLVPGDGTGETYVKDAVYLAILSTDGITIPTKKGYTFTGYADGNNKFYYSYNNSMLSAIEWDKASDATLTAQYGANTYYVHFDGNGKTDGSMADQKFTYDVEQFLTTNSFAKSITISFDKNGGSVQPADQSADLRLGGWKFGETIYADRANVKNLTDEANATVTFVAQWNNAEFTLPNPGMKTDYVFVGWYDGDKKVGEEGESYQTNQSVTLKALWEPEAKYTITFKNYDETVLQTLEVIKGHEPVYTGPDPTKPSTVDKVYTFAGWNPTLAPATENATYKATYTESVRKYTIKFVNYDDTELQSSEVEYGATPTYNGETPTKPSDKQYSYTFAGWDKEIVAVTGEATYKATYTSTTRKYDITFLQDDGTTLIDKQQLEYGATPTIADPTKQATAQYTYTFAGWNPTITTVTGDATYTATYNSTVNKYSIIFKNEDGTVLQNTEWEYGTTPKYSGATPTKARTDKYTYTFDKWTPDIVSVTKAADYTATYTETINKYQVTFNANGGTFDDGTTKIIEQTYDENYILPATNPTQEGYLFAGWWTEQAEGSGTEITATTPVKLGANQTVYAHWAAVEVKDVTMPTTLNFTTPSTQDATIEFTVTDGAKAEDFTYSVTSTTDGDAWEFKSLNVTGTKATITASYTATLETTKGDHTATVTLTSKGNTASTKSTTATANVNYTPVITWTCETTYQTNQDSIPLCFSVTAPTGEPLSDIELTYASKNENIATIVKNHAGQWVLHVKSAGNVTITATSTETEIYASGTGSAIIHYQKMPDEIVWNNGEPIPSFEANTYIPYGIAQSKNDPNDPNMIVTYESDNENVIKVTKSAVGSILTTVNPGTAKLTAWTSGNAKFEAAGPSTQTISVSKRQLKLIWDQIFLNFDESYMGKPIELEASVIDPSSEEVKPYPITFSFSAEEGTPAEINGSTLTIKGYGKGTITAHVTVPPEDRAMYDDIEETKSLRVRKQGEKCNTEIFTLSRVTMNNDKELASYYFGAPGSKITMKLHRNRYIGTGNNRRFYISVATDNDVQSIVKQLADFPIENMPTNATDVEYDFSDCPNARYLIFEFNLGGISDKEVYVENLSIMQNSYISSPTESIDRLAFARQHWTDTIILNYSDVSAIQYEMLHSDKSEITIEPIEGTEIDNDCGDFGAYKFVLKANWQIAHLDGLKDTIYFSSLTGEELRIPVKITVQATASYSFTNGERGDGDGKWSTSTNWSYDDLYTHGSIPHEYDKVSIDAPVLIDKEVAVNQISIYQDVTIAPNAGLTVWEGGVRGTGKVILQASINPEDAGQAYFRRAPEIQTPVFDNMPNATVQLATRSTLNTGANKDATWQYIGIPVENLNFNVDYITWLYRWDEQNGWIDYKAISDRTGSAPLKAWEGYAITQYGQPIYEFSGKLLNNDQTITLSRTETQEGMYGNNLFANSYASPIDVKRFTEDDFEGDLDKTFYIFNSGSWNQWDKHKEDIPTEKGHTLVAAAGQYIAIPALTAKGFDESFDQTMIAPMQGIYVVANADGAQIKLNYEKHVWNAKPRDSRYSQMNNPARAPKADTIAVDTTAVDSVDLFTLNRRVRMVAYGENSGADFVYVMEHNDYTRHYDNGCDAPKMFADVEGVLSLYTNEENTGLMSVAATNDVNEMFIGFNAGEDVNYKLFITSVIGDDLELMDMQTGDRFALRDSASYEFAATPNSEDPYRFRIFKSEKTPVVPTGWTGLGDKAKIWYNKQVIYISDAAANSTASIYTAAGELLEQVTFNHNTTISTQNIPEGVYTVRVEDSVLKVFVKH